MGFIDSGVPTAGRRSEPLNGGTHELGIPDGGRRRGWSAEKQRRRGEQGRGGSRLTAGLGPRLTEIAHGTASPFILSIH